MFNSISRCSLFVKQPKVRTLFKICILGFISNLLPSSISSFLATLTFLRRYFFNFSIPQRVSCIFPTLALISAKSSQAPFSSRSKRTCSNLVTCCSSKVITALASDYFLQHLFRAHLGLSGILYITHETRADGVEMLFPHTCQC